MRCNIAWAGFSPAALAIDGSNALPYQAANSFSPGVFCCCGSASSLSKARMSSRVLEMANWSKLPMRARSGGSSVLATHCPLMWA